MECSAFLLLWRRWIRFVVVVVYIVLLVIAVPLCIWELERNGAPDHVQAWFVGGMFVLMALPISFWGILQHIINYTTPHLQRYIIRILWMVPIYALNAWFALRFPDAAIYLDTLRECYEAYVIYNVMAYLLSFLNHEYPHLDIQIENKPPVKHIFPLCLLPPCQYSSKFIQRCKHGVLQYTVVRPAMTIIALICEMFDKYSEGDFNFKSAWSYLVIINNLSQILAMYCLVLFYKAFREELHPLKPVPKLLCVKAVVFLSFWQSLLIAALAKMGVIPEHGAWVVYKDVKAVATGLQDFIICIEMFVAAIAHYYSFSHMPFVNLAAEQQNCCASFMSMWNVRDVTEDVVEHARYIGRGMHKTLSRGKRLVRGGSSERSPLLVDTDDQEHGRRASAHSSFQNSQAASSVKAVGLDDDTVSSGGESLYSHRYDTFVNKSTTSSMMNYADFRSEASTQSESKMDLSRSLSLREYGSECDELEIERSQVKRNSREPTQVKVEAEVGALSGNYHQDEMVHLDVHGDKMVDLIDVRGNEIVHLDVHGNEKVSSLEVSGVETVYNIDVCEDETIDLLDIRGDETVDLIDVCGDETVHMNVHGGETVNLLEVQLDDMVHHLDVHGDDSVHRLDVYGDDLVHHLDVHGDDSVHNLDVHRDDSVHHLDVGGNEIFNILGVQEHEPASASVISLSAIARQATDMQDASIELLSAEKSEHSEILQDNHDTLGEINISHENHLQTSGHNFTSAGLSAAPNDAIGDVNQNDPVV